MNLSDALDNAASSLQMLEIAALAHETGWDKVLSDLSHAELTYEEEYDFAMRGIESLCAFVDYQDVDDDGYEVSEYHFSTKAMMNYYCLCRKYEKLTRISQKNNPYRSRAEQEVREHLGQEGCYYVSYCLQVKPYGKWSNRIIFRYDSSYFCEYLALFSRLLMIFAFYRDTTKELQREIKALETRKKGKVVPFPGTDKQKRRAA